MPPREPISHEMTWSNSGARYSLGSKRWSTRITQPHTRLDLETCADDGALYEPALTLANEAVERAYARAWRSPVPSTVEDGTAWLKLMLDTALRNPDIATYIQVVSDPYKDKQIVRTFIETSRGDIVEVLSPRNSYPSKMLIETILLLY